MRHRRATDGCGGDGALPIYSYPGLGRIFNRLLDAMASVREDQTASLHRSICVASRQLEFDIQRRGLGPEQLTNTTRGFRGWLALFCDEARLRQYQHARGVLEPLLCAGASERCRRPFFVHFRPMPGLFTLKTASHGSTLSLPTAMFSLNDETLVALTQQIFGRTPESKRVLFTAMLDAQYQTMQSHIEALGGLADEGRGTHHDLSASFLRVNERFFESRMSRPHLAWSRTLTGRKFGHYNFLRDSIIISRTLDDEEVPEFLLDYVIYHELLHKLHGLRWTDSTARAHTTEFYRDERKFPQYDEADALLQSLARSRSTRGRRRFARARQNTIAPVAAAALASHGD